MAALCREVPRDLLQDPSHLVHEHVLSEGVVGDLDEPAALIVARSDGRGRLRVVGRTSMWVPVTLRTSCDLLILVLILVEQPAKSVPSSDMVEFGCATVGEGS